MRRLGDELKGRKRWLRGSVQLMNLTADTMNLPFLEGLRKGFVVSRQVILWRLKPPSCSWNSGHSSFVPSIIGKNSPSFSNGKLCRPEFKSDLMRHVNDCEPGEKPEGRLYLNKKLCRYLSWQSFLIEFGG